MALALAKPMPSGHECTYHRIKSITIENSGLILILVESYKDSAARAANKAPVSALMSKHNKADFDFSQPLLQQAYTKLKAMPEYANAEDC